jgi:4-hydroxy-3-polyprenylbenzoate decarboxylase
MSINNLDEFISFLKSSGELHRVEVETDPVLEIAAITDGVCKQPGGGKALLFETPIGSGFRVATNLFGSERRVCLALGVANLDLLTERLSVLLDRIPEVDFEHLDTQIAALPEFACYAPRSSSNSDPDLMTESSRPGRLPAELA